MAFRKLALGLSLLALAACGDNPYAKREKKCKLNCDSEKNSTDQGADVIPRQSEALNFSLNFWLDTTKAVQVEKSDDIVVKEMNDNPIFFMNELLMTTYELSQGVASLKQQTEPKNPTQQCFVDLFNKEAIVGERDFELTVDYGRCETLKSKTEEANETNRTGVPKLVTEWDTGVYLYTRGQVETASGLNLITSGSNGLEIANIAPFKTVAASDLASTMEIAFDLLFSRAAIQTTHAIQNNKVALTSRNWVAFSIGEDKSRPMNVKFNPTSKTVTLNGPFWISEAGILNPKDLKSFVGELNYGGSKVYYFVDFQVSGTNVALNPSFGFSSTANLSGSYLLVTSGYQFRMEGQNKPCVVKAYQVFETDNETTEELLGTIDLCKTL